MKRFRNNAKLLPTLSLTSPRLTRQG